MNMQAIYVEILRSILLILPLVFSVAYLTYAERKILAAVQLRLGPFFVGKFGLLQPIADAVKSCFKEILIPRKADKLLFVIAPMIAFIMSIVGWVVMPYGATVLADGQVIPKIIANLNIGILYVMAITGLEIYGIIIAGWASNSNYAFLSSLRAASQMISYELPIGFIFIIIIMLSGSFSLFDIVQAKHNAPIWVDIFMFPMLVIFIISILAETNRHPFDLPESETELVAGYSVEYSSMLFVLFYFGEYANMILTSALTTVLFLGGWYPPLPLEILDFVPGIVWFILKICCILFIFIFVRALLPRYRYDQLMRFCWKLFIPITVVWFIMATFLFKMFL